MHCSKRGRESEGQLNHCSCTNTIQFSLSKISGSKPKKIQRKDEHHMNVHIPKKKIPASSKTYKTSLIRNNNITQTKSSLIHTTFIKHNNNSEPSHKEGRRRTDSEPGSCTTTTRNRTNEGRKGNRLLSLCFLFDVFIFATSILDLVRSPHPFSKIISEMKQGR